MKKLFVYCASLVAAAAVGASVVTFGSMHQAQVKAADASTAAGWVDVQGTPKPITDVTNGVQIGSFEQWSSDCRTAEEVLLDGLGFDYRMDYTAAALTNGGLNFYFSDSTAFGWSGPVLSVIPEKISTQVRIKIAANHDPSGADTNYQAMADDAATGFGDAAGLVFNKNATQYFDFHFGLNKVNDNWWKITITEGHSNMLWGFPNVNVTTGSGLSYAETYIPASGFPAAADGKAYLHLSANPGGLTPNSVTITNFQNGSLPLDIDGTKDKINALTADLFPLADISQELATLKAQAIDAAEAATTGVELDAIYPALVEDVRDVYATKLNLNDTISGTSDATANWLNYISNYGVKRANDRGGILLDVVNVFGGRGKSVNTYDPLNVEVKLNLLEADVGTENYVLFANQGTALHISDAGHAWHVAFYKGASDKYIVMVGNGTSHNISDTEWTSNASSIRGDFKGIDMTSISGDFDIKIVPNYETGKASISVNDQSAVFDISHLVGNDVTVSADNPLSGYYFSLGALDPNPAGANLKNRVLVDSIIDPTMAAYLSDFDANVAAKLQAINNAKDAVVALAGSEGLDDDTIGDVADYKAIITNQTGFASYDYNALIKETADDALEVVEELEAAYLAKVSAAKAAFTTWLDETYPSADYREDDKTELETAKAAILESLEAITTIGGVDELKATAKATLDAIPTDAQRTADEEFAAYKETLKAELEAYADIENIEDDEVMEAVAAAVRAGKTEIDEATSKDDADAALVAAKAAIDALKTPDTPDVPDSSSGGDTSSEAPVDTSEVTSEASVPETSEGGNNRRGCGGSIAAASGVAIIAAASALGLAIARKKHD